MVSLSRRFAFGLIVALVSGVTASAATPTVLKHKYQKGKEAIYRTSSSMEQTQSVAGQKFTTEMKQTQVYAVKVDEVDSDGTAKLKLKTEQVKMAMEVKPVIAYEFDSKSTKNDSSSQIGSMLTPVIEKIVGSETLLTVKSAGRITAAKGQLENLKDAIGNNPIAKQLLEGMIDEKATMVGLQDNIPIFSDKAVGPGDTWESETENELAFIKSKSKRKYTIEAEDKVGDFKTWRIKVSVTGSVELNIDQGGQKVSGTMNVGSSSGTLQFDPVSGLIIKQTVMTELSGQLNVEANGMNLTVDTKQDSTNTIELLPKLP